MIKTTKIASTVLALSLATGAGATMFANAAVNDAKAEKPAAAKTGKVDPITKESANLAKGLGKTAVSYDKFAARFTERAKTDTLNAAALTAAATAFTDLAGRARTLQGEASAATTKDALKAVRAKVVTLHKDAAAALRALGQARVDTPDDEPTPGA